MQAPDDLQINCDRWVSTPIQIANAKFNNSSNVLATKSSKLDGIICLGNGFDLLRVSGAFAFKSKLTLKACAGKSFKGVSELAEHGVVHECNLGTTATGLTMSLIIYESKGYYCGDFPEYTQALSQIHCAINKSILGLERPSKSRSTYTSSDGATRLVYKRDAFRFNQLLDCELKRNFGVYFMLRRMGQNVEICSDELANFSNELALPYIEIDVTNMLSCVLHVAVDVKPESGYTFIWNVKKISQHLGNPHNTYYIFALPGKGNVQYDWQQLENSHPVKHVQMYLRAGHEIHRNQDQFFSKCIIAEMLTKLQGVLLQSDKQKFVETRAEKLLLQGNFVPWVNALAESVISRPSLRCEVAFQQRKIQNLPLQAHFNIGITCSLDWIAALELSDPSYYFALPSAVLRRYILTTLQPCAKTILKISEPLNKALKSFQNTPNKKSDTSAKSTQSKWNRKKHKTDNKNLQLQIPSLAVLDLKEAMGPQEILNVLAAECIIGYFFRGRVPINTPKLLHRYLGFGDIEQSGPSKGTIKRVIFRDDGITCKLNLTTISSCIPAWVANYPQHEIVLSLVTILTEFAETNRSKVEYLNNLLKDIVVIFCNFIQYVSSIQQVEAESPVPNEFDLLYLKKLNRERPTRLRRICPTYQFVSMLSDPARMRPVVIVTQFQSICEIVQARDHMIRNFKEELEHLLNRYMFFQKTPLFFQSLATTTVAVIPSTPLAFKDFAIDSSELQDSMITLYSEALLFAYGDDVAYRQINFKAQIRNSINEFHKRINSSAEGISLECYLFYVYKSVTCPREIDRNIPCWLKLVLLGSIPYQSELSN